MRIVAFRSWLASILWLAVVGAAVARLPDGKKCLERMKADVYYFSSDTLEGRGISTPGSTSQSFRSTTMPSAFSTPT